MFKRDNTWWTCFRIDGKKIRRSLETSNKKLAEAIEGQIKADIVKGKFLDISVCSNRNFKELSEKYLAEWTVKKSLKSQERDKGIFKNYLNPFFENMLLADIHPKHVSRYKQQRKTKKASRDTINKELGLMKAAFNVAIREWEWVDSNPVSRVRMERAGEGRVRFLTQQEFSKLYKNCEDWVKPFVIIARYTGLRMGNVLALSWGQIDLFRKIITVDKTKNGDPIGIPVCETLFKTLKSLNKVRDIKSKNVFPTKLSYNALQRRVQRAFKTACNASGIEKFRWHDLRHDFASMLIQRGVDIYTVQILLGHKDGRMTRRYAHLSPENLRSAVKVLDETAEGGNFGHNLDTMGSI